ncbi:hypothetical protein CAI21_19030 [Alkalilimnicola ehrlichii]|uniref:diguanylate cyclase n=1 Tax=Alkalilimnicola ehrlichii TaxID=351052 RepID=A0A3E0WKV8_9GAMM|nr:diguanylate cyclase [Alkalilimnicola ehrlichii]RFA25530.1 hypothetical protein CAI21_19030 [Alkalilimnicola ehrlichii]RFA32616.1 hypothetical protein CAL65_19280 [Alkalilimnicola ehrlichii]
MINDTSAPNAFAALVWPHRHAADFTASRASYITDRVRTLALALAILLPLWIPVDYLLLSFPDFVVLAGLRLGMAGLALLLYFLSPSRGGRLAGAWGRLALLMLIPFSLYVAARLQLGPADGDMLYGYAFFPVLVAAMLAVFPLTLLEGVLVGFPLLMGYAVVEGVFGAPAEPHWLGMLWLLALIVAIGVWTQLSQLRMLLDLSWRATRDPLTGALNQRSLAERLQAEHARWERYGRPLSVLAVELRSLDTVFRQHGADIANRLVAEVTEAVDRALRPTDLIGRWDDNTLIAVLPETEEAAARQLAARVREVSELASIRLSAGVTVRGEQRVAVAVPVAQENLTAFMARVVLTSGAGKAASTSAA